MSRRVAILPVTAECLRQVLHLPESVRIDNASWDINYDCILLRLEGTDFPEALEGEVIPRISANYRVLHNGEVEFHGWAK